MAIKKVSPIQLYSLYKAFDRTGRTGRDREGVGVRFVLVVIRMAPPAARSGDYFFEGGGIGDLRNLAA